MLKLVERASLCSKFCTNFSLTCCKHENIQDIQVEQSDSLTADNANHSSTYDITTGAKVCKILIFANKLELYEYILGLFENFGSNLGGVMVVIKFQEVGLKVYHLYNKRNCMACKIFSAGKKLVS